jgi:hydrogenase small subunit
MGCRGPQVKANCGIVRWNRRRSWCVESGGPCIGCCVANPNNSGENWVETNTPFRARFRDLRIGGAVVQPEAIAWTVTGILAAALVVHGFGMKKAGRTDGGAPFEEKREWDKKHPNESIGIYTLDDNSKGGN